MGRRLPARRHRRAALRSHRGRSFGIPRRAAAAAARFLARPRDRRAMSLTGKALKAGVMGWPVGHSRSPALHGWWLAQYRIDGAYVPMAVQPRDLAAALRALPLLGFPRSNLTIPHK